MTLKEFGTLASAIKTYYPKENILPTRESVELWYDALKDIDYKFAEYGLRKYAMLNKFPPAISDIRECALEFQEPKELNEMEAWSLVSNALRKSGYGAEEEFFKLPPIVQKAVGTPKQLRIWAMDENYNESVVSSNFMRTYRTECHRAKQIANLPENLKTMIEGVNEHLAINAKAYEPEQEENTEIFFEKKTMPDNAREKYEKMKKDWLR